MFFTVKMTFFYKNVAKGFTKGAACINLISFNAGIRITMRYVDLIAVPFPYCLFRLSYLLRNKFKGREKYSLNLNPCVGMMKGETVEIAKRDICFHNFHSKHFGR